MNTREVIFGISIATAGMVAASCNGSSPETEVRPTVSASTPGTETASTTATETTQPPPIETTTTAGGLAITTTTEVERVTTSSTLAEVVCRPFSDTVPKARDYSLETGARLSSLVGSAARLGEWPKPCTERFVLEFQGAGDPPGWKAEYRPYEQVTGPSGEPPDIRGQAFLTLTAGSWMYPAPDHRGPNVLRNDGLDVIHEAVLVENFEGLTMWALGLEEQRPFTVTELTDPYRIVIDVYDPVKD